MLLLFSACGGVPSTPVPEREPIQPEMGNLPRSLLTYTDLMEGFTADSPVDEAALTIQKDTASPLHTFEGRLELLEEERNGSMTVHKGELEKQPEAGHLPPFDFEFVQSQGYLIPVQRGLIVTDHPYWNYFLEPGRVWQESGDQGYTRASFPFALSWKGSNAIFNGTMTFLFNEDGISKVWYQVTQETSISTSLDMWGLLDARYKPGPVPASGETRAAFARELADRFPAKSIEKISEDYPGVDLSAFGRGVNQKNMTWYGFVVNGVNYVSGCKTRFGEYPYCEYMRAPSYSTAKSIFASVALMRLAQKFDPDMPRFLVREYLPETAGSIGDWSAVTFDNVLDMATGNFESAGNMIDEEHWDTDPFWNEEYYDQKIAAALNWPHSADPGTTWVYRTFDTFILTRAMQNYLQAQDGQDADIFDFVVEEVYKPLGMGPGVFSTLRTRDDNWQGQPYGGYGMWWIPDDLAKISDFLNVEDGRIAGEQILHPGLLASTLQRDPEDRGVDRGSRGKYNNAFWADRYGKNAGYACEFWVAEMLGYSGIVVVLMPNSTSYYYASDGRQFTWDAAVMEANKIAPFCPQE